MPIEWVPSRVVLRERVRSFEPGELEVRHWKGHDPHALVDALKRESAPRVGYSPPVSRHAYAFPYGRLTVERTLAAREFEAFRSNGLLHGSTAADVFHYLDGSTQGLTGLVETPVALMHQPATGRSAIVTVWKEGTRSLREFLYDRDVSMHLKRRAMLGAMRKLARLHDAGFIHGHVKTDNLVVTPRGTVHFADITGVYPSLPAKAEQELELALNNFGHVIDDEHLPGLTEHKLRRVYNENRLKRPVRAPTRLRPS